MGYAGWHGVTDPRRILIAVSYEPIEGHLACRFITGEPLIHEGVPERLYLILLKSPFAGSYYRKHIMNKFPCPYAENPPPYKPTDGTLGEVATCRAKASRKRIAEYKPELDLFGEHVRRRES